MSTVLYEQVKANLTWYMLNSNYQDPMYQSMYKLEQEMYFKYIYKQSNFNNVDNFFVHYKTEVLQYGSYQCSASGKEAYMDSIISCFLFQLPFFLEKIHLGYIGFVFVIPIMLISLFGGIKESYKWFILNQAIWDLFVCYDFICARPTLIGWSSTTYYSETTCFYKRIATLNHSPAIEVLTLGFRQFLRNGPFIPVFLLAFSRFLAMYFSTFYKNFTKSGYKVLIFILIFNAFCILLFCTPSVWEQISVDLMLKEYEYCANMFCPSRNSTYCYQNNQKYFQCMNEKNNNNNVNQRLSLLSIPRNIQHLIPPTMFLLSIIFVAALFYKIAAQLKFQKATNQSAFNQTIKISSVVGFQCLIMSIIFVVTGIQKYVQLKANISGNFSTVYTDLPPWLFLLQYCTTTISLNMIRVFLDSILVLSILSGYSKCMIVAFKFIGLCVCNPKMAVKKIKCSILKRRKNAVTIITPISEKT